MYAFQEVHTYNSSPCGSSTSRVDIIHEGSGLRTRYYGKTLPPVPHTYPWVFDEFYGNVKEDRIQMFVNGKKLPVKKENYPTTQIPPDVWECTPCTAYVSPIVPNTFSFTTPYLTLGDCKPAPTPLFPAKTLSSYGEAWNLKQETSAGLTSTIQGNNPMRYDDMYTTASKSNTNVAGSSTVINMTNESDESKQRAYIMEEFNTATSWLDQTRNRMVKLFNLNAPKVPTSTAAILDAFKNGKFTSDQAKIDLNAKFHALEDGGDEDYEDRYDSDDQYIGAMYYGITFTDLPVADSKGFQAAMAEYETLKKNVKRTIIVGTPAEGLAALISLETFAPTTPTLH